MNTRQQWGPHANETLCAVLQRLSPEEGVVYNAKEGVFGWALPQMVANTLGGGAHEMGVPHLVLRLERFASFPMASEAFEQFARFVTFTDLDDGAIVSPNMSFLAKAAAREQTASGQGFDSKHSTHKAVQEGSRRPLYEVRDDLDRWQHVGCECQRGGEALRLTGRHLQG